MRNVPADPAAAVSAALVAAAARVTGLDEGAINAALSPSRADGADVQSTLAMSLAKKTGRPAPELAAEILAAAQLDGLVEDVSISGNPPKQAFINLRYDTGMLNELVAARLADPRAGVPVAASPERVVIDYSSPNVAKSMHVGHLRSTIIGDTLARTLSAVGHDVVRQNHLGDWGTQFGMLVEHLDESDTDLGQASMDELVALYRGAKARFDDEPGFADRARARVVALQAGDEATRATWTRLVGVSTAYAQDIYRRLDVTLAPEDVRGESFYNDRLGDAVAALETAGLVTRDQGALVVHDDAHAAPMIVEKSGGGYGYAATDLAALRYRADDLAAARLVYVTDSRQSQHFAQVFGAAERAGWLGDSRAEHVPFGMVMGPDGKPFKTRDGENVTLESLLDAAEERAYALVSERSPDMNEAEQRQIAAAVGIGAVKYADLSAGRTRDYRFDVERMVSFQGDTGPYLQYAQRRAAAVGEKAEAAGLAPGAVQVSAAAERALVLKLAAFGPAVESAAETLEPHRVCGYLHGLASAYTEFYEKCPVLKAEDAATRASRVALCGAVERTLDAGLGLIGLRTLPRM